MTAPNPLDLALTALQMAVTYGSGISGCKQSYLPPELLDLLREAATAIEEKQDHEMFAALEAQRTVPAGYAIVPEEPTPEMIKAGYLSKHRDAYEPEADIYKAMLAAAAPTIIPAHEQSALDTKRLNFVEARLELHLIKKKNRWSSVGLRSYEFSTYRTLRECIDSAIGAGEGEQT